MTETAVVAKNPQRFWMTKRYQVVQRMEASEHVPLMQPET
jgi:hypothetical protein